MESYQVNKEEIRDFVTSTLKVWHKPVQHIPLLEHFLLVEQATMVQEKDTQLTVPRAAKQVVLDCLAELRHSNQPAAKLLSQRYEDNRQIKEIVKIHRSANEHATLEQIKHRIRKAIEQLTNIAYEKECQLRADAIYALQHRLPNPTYHKLFGVTKVCETVKQRLLSQADNSWIVVVCGIGGIGKTSLVLEVVKDVLQQFHFREVVWLSFREGFVRSIDGEQALFNRDALTNLLLRQLDPTASELIQPELCAKQLRHLLEARPTLLIVDNLEGKEATENLLEWLIPLANPLQIIITARELPVAYPKLSCHFLTELRHAETAALIRQHIETVDSPTLSEGDTDLVDSIYAAVGGNPFAIKLIVGLAAYLPLRAILNDLVSAKHQDIYHMYQHIFEKAWSSLNADAKLVLTIMPLATEKGMLFERLQHNSELDFGRLSIALDQLRRCSLIDVNGNAVRRYYTIHQLTRAYLGSSIIGWEGNLPGA